MSSAAPTLQPNSMPCAPSTRAHDWPTRSEAAQAEREAGIASTRTRMPELKSQYLFTITLSVDALHDVGNGPLGTLHIDMLGKGAFEGPRLRGEILPGGMDMKTLRTDGAMQPNVRL